MKRNLCGPYQSLLIENLIFRPSVPSFDELLKKLKESLVSENLASPGDVTQWMNDGHGHVRCYVNGEEVKVQKTKGGRKRCS